MTTDFFAFPDFVEGDRSRSCQYMSPAGVRCGAPVHKHVVWNEEGDNSFVCDVHLESVKQYCYFSLHDPVEPCGQMGSTWVEELDTCVWPEELKVLDALAELAR